MILGELWRFFEKEIFQMDSTELLFNQYKDNNLDVDTDGGNEIRKENLRKYFESFDEKPTVLAIGEAPGPWGCRFSGIPFTSERQLIQQNFLFHGKQSSNTKLVRVKHKKSPFSLNTSKIFWDVMNEYHPKFFVWNCVPFHPYKHDDILSVRTPTKLEVKRYSEMLKKIIDIINPDVTLAVGKKAFSALERIGEQSKYVRHPSYGGAKEFKTGMIAYL